MESGDKTTKNILRASGCGTLEKLLKLFVTSRVIKLYEIYRPGIADLPSLASNVKLCNVCKQKIEI